MTQQIDILLNQNINVPLNNNTLLDQKLSKIQPTFLLRIYKRKQKIGQKIKGSKRSD